MKRTIAFANREQAVIFEGELKGQISDGFWENARPFNHWENICKAEVVVYPSNVGYSGFHLERNYNFACKELVEYVGDRMIKYAKTAILLPSYSPQAIVYVVKYADKIIEAYETGDTSFDFIKKLIKKYSIKLKDVKYAKEQLDFVDYEEKDLKKDLRAIKATLKK